ncbi:MAG: tetratricopeptide repeat protein [Pirellulales bacterium]|nr:tetratricopeptide repeat protein [Pirellulales bacterium]
MPSGVNSSRRRPSGGESKGTSRAAPDARSLAWPEMLIRGAIIAAVGLLAIWPALPGGFVWDDVLIPQGRYVKADDGLVKFWTTGKQADYWPVAYSTHWFEYRAFGARPIGYRCVNVALHIGNALLLWRALTMLRVPGAWWAALLFVAHPVTVEAVAWILQRKTLLSTAFGLGTFISYLHFRASPDGWPKWSWYAAALVLFALGMLTKTAIVMLPLAMPASVWLLERRVTWGDLWLLVPLLVIAVALGCVGLYFQETKAIGVDVVRDDSLVSRVALFGRSFWFYVSKALCPVNLTFIYPRWPLGIQGPQTFVPLLALIAVTGGLIYATVQRWSTAPLAALAWYGLNLVPVSGLANIYFMRYSLVADHWQYLSLPALIALVVVSTIALVERIKLPTRWLPAAALSAVAFVLTALSWNQAHIYAGDDNRLLWRDTIAKNPDAWIALNNLGTLFNHDGETAANEARRAAAQGRRVLADQSQRAAQQSFDDAVGCFRRALVLYPKYSDAEQNWGMNLLVQGQHAEAMRHFQSALDMSPPKTAEHAKAHVYVGLVLRAIGRANEALPHFQAAVTDLPHYVQANEELGRALLEAGRPREAEAPLKAALSVNPHLPLTAARLGEVYVALGRHDEAIGAFDHALQVNPGLPDVHTNLAILLAMRRAFEPAIAHYRQAIQHEPTHVRAHLGLGVALAEIGRYDEAIAEYEKVLELSPEAADARTNLANALLMTGRREDALVQYQETLLRHSDFLPARVNYASALAESRQWGEAIAQFKIVLKQDPNHQDAALQLAWLLATSPDDDARDPAEALRLADALCRATVSPDPRQLDVLAAAQAASGRYDEAIQNVDQAIARLQAAGQKDVKVYLERRQLYEAKQPFRLPKDKS